MKKEMLILFVIVGAFALLQSLNFVRMPDTKSSPLLLQTNDETFLQHLDEAGDWVLLDFWAPWCAPCLRLKPAISALAEANEGRLQVLSINVDEAPGLVEQFPSQGIPTLILLYKGREIDRRTGGMPKPVLLDWVNSLIESSVSSTSE
jgi:thioredoxin